MRRSFNLYVLSGLLLSALSSLTQAQTQNTTYSFQYDANGNLTQMTDPLGRITNQQYDALNRVKQQLQPAPTSGAARPAIYYSYDGLDQVTKVIDPRNLSTSYTVNGLGNVTTQTSPDTGSTSNMYDEAGNLKSSKDGRGLVTTYSYDAVNRLTKITYASGTPTTFEYGSSTTPAPHAKGRLIKITDESGHTTFTYDALGRVLSKTQTSNTATPKSFTVSYSYDSGKLLTMTYPSGNKLNFGYNAAGQVDSIALTASNGSTTTLLSDIGYAPFGPVQAWKWGNHSATSAHTYARGIDLDGRIISYPLGNPLQQGLQRSVNYDAASRITGTTHTGLGTGTNTPANYNQSFGYDDLDRLTSTMASTTSQTFRYDASGNRTHMSYGRATELYTTAPDSNRLTQLGGSAPQRDYLYDGAGNVVGDRWQSYTYNARGRMSSATAYDRTVQYFYNGIGQRTRKESPYNGSTHFMYDDQGQLLGEYDASGKAIQETVYLDTLPVALLKPGTNSDTKVYYVFADHIDTPRVITQASDNQMVWRWDYADPFGQQMPDQNPAGLGTFKYNLRFPGQYYDEETSLRYNYFRDYDPATGRYIQSDPIGLFGGINTYAYALSNPLSYVDPLGLDAISDRAAGIPPGRTGDQYSSKYNKCMYDYLVANYGHFVADTLVPGFSVFSYIPGSGYTTDAWTTTVQSAGAKGAVGYGVYKAGSAMATQGGATGTVGNAMTKAAPYLAKAVVVAGTGVTAFATAAQAMAMKACSSTCEK